MAAVNRKSRRGEMSVRHLQAIVDDSIAMQVVSLTGLSGRGASLMGAPAPPLGEQLVWSERAAWTASCWNLEAILETS